MSNPLRVRRRRGRPPNRTYEGQGLKRGGRGAEGRARSRVVIEEMTTLLE